MLDILFGKSENIERDDFELSLLLFITCISHRIVYKLIKELFEQPLTSGFRKINYMINFISRISREFIMLLGPQEFSELKAGFNDITPYNGTILAIDSTHIRINKPVLNGIK